MFAGLSLKTNPPSQKTPPSDTASKPNDSSATSSFSFMSSSVESEVSATSAPSSGRNSPIVGNVGGFSFMNNDKKAEEPTPASNGFSFMNNENKNKPELETVPTPAATPTTNGFSFMNASKSEEPPATTGFSFVSSVPNEPSTNNLSTLISSPTPATIPLATSSTKVVKKKRASKVRVGYARDTDDDQPAPTPPVMPNPTPPAQATPMKSLNIKNEGSGAIISDLDGDDLPSSVMAEITAAEMLEKRLKAEQEEREIAEAIEAVAKAEAEAKAEEETKAQIAAAEEAALQAQQPTSPSSFTDKAKSWFMGSTSNGPTIETKSSPDPPLPKALDQTEHLSSTAPITFLPSPPPVKVAPLVKVAPPVEVEPPVEVAPPVEVSPPVEVVVEAVETTQTTATVTLPMEHPATPLNEDESKMETTVVHTESVSMELTTQVIIDNVEKQDEVIKSNETSLTEELDFILSEFVNEMETICETVETHHDQVSELEQNKVSIGQNHAEALQTLHNLESKQNLLAEAEDYEGAEALTTMVDELQNKVKTIQEEIILNENNLINVLSKLELKRTEQENCIFLLEKTLQEFENKSHKNDKDTETQTLTFNTESRRLAAERDRLSAERGHVGRDRKHLEDERGETENNINSQTKEITQAASQIQLELTGVEGDIANLEKLLLAKKAEAQQLSQKLDASTAAVNAVRLKFDRQLQRIAEREVIIRRSEMECDSEEVQLKQEELIHETALTKFYGHRDETQRIKEKAINERNAAESLRVSLKERTEARRGCHHDMSNKQLTPLHGDTSSSIEDLRAAVLDAEDRAVASETKLNEAVTLMESLKEEAKACSEKIPQLEAAKKAAAAAKNFKEAGALSKEAKATEIKGEECRSEAAKVAKSLDLLENNKIECHKHAIEVRELLSQAEKELDLKKLYALRKLAIELRHAELKAEAKLNESSSDQENIRNGISFSAVMMAKSDVKIIMKDIMLLSNRIEIEDDWHLPTALPPCDDDEVNDINEHEEKDAIVVDNEHTRTDEEEEEEEEGTVVENDNGPSVNSDTVVDEEQEELERALRNLSGSMLSESQSADSKLSDLNSPVVKESLLPEDEANDDDVVVVEQQVDGEEEVPTPDNAEAKAAGLIQEEEARLKQEKEEEEARLKQEEEEARLKQEKEEEAKLKQQQEEEARLKQEKEDEINIALYVEQVQSILAEIDNLESQTLEAAESEDFDLADELQQQVYEKEEEVKTFGAISNLHEIAVETAKKK